MKGRKAAVLRLTRRAAKAGEAGAEIGRQEAEPAATHGYIRERQRCGCCRAIYELTQRGRAFLARLARDEEAG